MHIYNWDPWAAGRIRPPLIFGHEFCGEICELGEGVSKKEFPPSTLATAEGHFVCGKCEFCRTGQGHVCEKVVIIGVDVSGCFAQYVRVPKENVWVVDPDTPIEVACVHDPSGTLSTPPLSTRSPAQAAYIPPTSAITPRSGKKYGRRPGIQRKGSRHSGGND
ncbi:MAG: alcohol dehydrogenase catalytic domain-containing protein [Bacillota bacterium]